MPVFEITIFNKLSLTSSYVYYYSDYENRDAHESEWDEGESQFDNERELSDCSSVIEIDGDNYENQSSGKNG